MNSERVGKLILLAVLFLLLMCVVVEAGIYIVAAPPVLVRNVEVCQTAGGVYKEAWRTWDHNDPNTTVVLEYLYISDGVVTEPNGVFYVSLDESGQKEVRVKLIYTAVNPNACSREEYETALIEIKSKGSSVPFGL